MLAHLLELCRAAPQSRWVRQSGPHQRGPVGDGTQSQSYSAGELAGLAGDALAGTEVARAAGGGVSANGAR